MTKYEDEDWKDLPDEVKEAAKKLGYTKKMWNGDKGEDGLSDAFHVQLVPAIKMCYDWFFL